GKPNVLASNLPAAPAAARAGTKEPRSSSTRAPGLTAVEIKERTGEGAHAPPPQQQQGPAKRRRNLDFGNSKAGARGSAGVPVAHPSVELFVPEYGSRGAGDGDGRGS
ncbi:unnamed protein product, partial [Hapterophycus canaliculatus]